ncbi:MAG: transcription-repair coupling factor [Lachnospiraceae bacterium]|nr:transcription-repair coupling factor [Lachnospiraceae bacterium]
MQSYLKNVFESSAVLSEASEAVLRDRCPVFMNGVSMPVKAFIAAGMESDTHPFRLIITYDEIRAREWVDHLSFYEEQAPCAFPAKDVIFFQADLSGGELSRQRMETFRMLVENNRGVVVTTIAGLMNLLPPAEFFLDHYIHIKTGDELDLTVFARRLTNLGYRRVGMVEEAGEFSIRGGILDLFPMTENNPVRVELFGDEVDSIRRFDVESQRSIENIEELTVFPGKEFCLTGEQVANGAERIRKDLERQYAKLRKQGKISESAELKRNVEEVLRNAEEFQDLSGLEAFLPYFYPEGSCLLDYFPKGKLLIIVDEPERIAESAVAVWTEITDSMQNRLLGGFILPKQAEISFSDTQTLSRIEGSVLMLSQFDNRIRCRIPAANDPARKSFSMDSGTSTVSQTSFDLLVGDLERYHKDKWRLIILTSSRTRGQRQAKMLEDYELNAFYSEEPEDLKDGMILVSYGSLPQGFEIPSIRFAMITEAELSGGRKKTKQRRKHTEHTGRRISDFNELHVGDYVIHENYGLGIYQGIVNKRIDDQPKDYISILYGDGGTLYIPATGLHQIQKYSDGDAGSESGKKPKLNRLGTQDWTKTKERVKGAVWEIARDLVELYAKRQHGRGFVFSEDNEWQREFEELFPFEETDDQMRAIEETKADMESPRIMDRLICGDVGYGKTEIALRAAFKAVMDGKQVVLICPTTILAEQHYRTFVQRMKDFPVKVGLLCRLRSSRQQEETVKALRKGEIDIVIGTHRLFSADISFKDLGLLIVDEEQRFGVRHKEKIKILRENIDVLTLSATPIPRTLHMSMIGIRDMSVLEEPPGDRLPIQTYVMEMNPELVREAINRELARGGQVYYVYNRVKDIAEVAGQLAEMLPDANISYAHGKMGIRELEQVMTDFVNREIDVLVSTTIIETGMDISNVNTIIIHDADRFGLSQLYQLRGRVGRSNRTAYAFIMYRKGKTLTEVAEKRLNAIREYTRLGSGIRIAMRDLEIRGAGNLLGEAQSGYMMEVGYDLYCKMLNEAVISEKQALEDREAEEELLLAMNEEEAEEIREKVRTRAEERRLTEMAMQFDTTVDLKISAYIPGEYILNENQKLDIYKRIAGIESREEMDDMRDELLDRFGDLPHSVEHLLRISYLRMLGHKNGVTAIGGDMTAVSVAMFSGAKVDFAKLSALLESHKEPALIPKKVPGAARGLSASVGGSRVPKGFSEVGKRGNQAGTRESGAGSRENGNGSPGAADYYLQFAAGAENPTFRMTFPKGKKMTEDRLLELIEEALSEIGSILTGKNR